MIEARIWREREKKKKKKKKKKKREREREGKIDMNKALTKNNNAMLTYVDDVKYECGAVASSGVIGSA